MNWSVRDKPLDFWIKWSATVLTLFHVWVTSHDWAPWYKFTGLIVAVLWTWLGYLWHQPSIILLNVILCAIYLKGIFFS